METSEIKAICVKELTDYVTAFRTRRKDVTEATVREFLKPRQLDYVGNPFPAPKDAREMEIEALRRRLAELEAT